MSCQRLERVLRNWLFSGPDLCAFSPPLLAGLWWLRSCRDDSCSQIRDQETTRQSPGMSGSPHCFPTSELWQIKQYCGWSRFPSVGNIPSHYAPTLNKNYFSKIISIKEIVHPKMTITHPFTHPCVIPKPVWLSLSHWIQKLLL